MILFAWRRLPPPGFIGGAEITEGLVAATLARAGHEVGFVGSANNPREPAETQELWLRALLARARISIAEERDGFSYRWRGVRCWCVAQHALATRAEALLATRARVLWTSQEGCDELASLAPPRVQVATYAHSVTDVGLLSTSLDATWIFVPSLFVQSVLVHDRGVQSTLLRPPIERARSRGEAPRDQVVMVNPIAEKGVELVLAVARRLPHRRFVLIDAWRPCDVPPSQRPSNVTVLPRQPHLAHIWQHAAILVVPSQVDDAAPRVIPEASVAGTVPLGARRGGIPELVADPRYLLEEDPGAWADCVEALLTQPSRLQAAGRRQRRHIAELRMDLSATARVLAEALAAC